MFITSHNSSSVHVTTLLKKIGLNNSPTIVPVNIDFDSEQGECFINVKNKVLKSGGNIHYGWVIYQTSFICEAERHAVWEVEDGKLIDITPRLIPFDKILFVSDNENFSYNGQVIDNVRINITQNIVVDHFILLNETISYLYGLGSRKSQKEILLPEPIVQIITQLEAVKIQQELFLLQGGSAKTRCFCGRGLKYEDCHGVDVNDGFDYLKEKANEIMNKSC